MWEQRLQQINRPGGGVCVAYLTGGDMAASFQKSFRASEMYDSAFSQRMRGPDGTMRITQFAGSGSIPWARNDSVTLFLDDPSYREAEFLLFVDSDMAWDGHAPEQLASTMEDMGLPILGGLCFTQRVLPEIDQNTPETEWYPTLYLWDEEQAGFVTQYRYPADTVVEVGATGGAFLMISRTCLEKLRESEGDDWFTPVKVDGNRRPFGEDLSFCLRARQHGFPTHVHTGVKTSHRKSTWITEAGYRQMRHPASSAVTVIIPVKDRLDLTRALVRDLVNAGGYTDLIIFDNGSGPETKAWLEAQTVADVYDAEGADLHEMWNAGISEAIGRHHGLADVVILNNDLRCGPRFLWRLIDGLRSLPELMAACGNYDGRRGSGVVPLQSICANRYDGTGGLAGFAFALRAEWVASGYRFPTDMKWWYGDNDLCLSIEKASGWYGMVTDALVEHVGGGSQTATPEGWDEILAADREAFMAKWPTVTLNAA